MCSGQDAVLGHLARHSGFVPWANKSWRAVLGRQLPTKGKQAGKATPPTKGIKQLIVLGTG